MSASKNSEVQTPALSESIAGFVANFDPGSIPAHVRERARLLMLDSIGIAFASHGYDFSHRALQAIQVLNEGNSSIVIGSDIRLDLRNAILINGILIHGLDFDDTHSKGVIHATASVLPTVLGLAAKLGRSGSDMVTAYVLGMEVATRLGAVAKGGFHQVGFHPTGLIGTFGCTVAAGWLLGLNPQQLVHAQGLSLSVASGSLEFLNDGAWNKRMHPGWAGVAAITAAEMARAGYVGTRMAYEGRFGLFPSHLGDRDYDLSLALSGLGQDWETTSVSVKPLPACHFTHASIDAASRLHKRGINIHSIDRIRVLVPAEVVKTVCEPEQLKRQPANSYEAQFSIPYLVSIALLKGDMTLEDLEETALRSPEVLALAAKTHYEIDPDSGFPKYYSGEVIIEFKDGSKVSEREAIHRGAVDRPLTADDILRKYRANAGRERSPDFVKQVEQAVLGLESMRVTDLAGLLGQKQC